MAICYPFIANKVKRLKRIKVFLKSKKNNSEVSKYLKAGDIPRQLSAKLDHYKYFKNIAPPCTTFVGRDKLLNDISMCCNSEKVSICALVGFGGVGKSTIARKWLDSAIEEAKIYDGFFWWCFSENADLECFIDALISFVSHKPIEEFMKLGLSAKVDEIKQTLCEREFIIVLDKFENLQDVNNIHLNLGSIKYSDIADLLSSCCEMDSRGLIILTTRYSVKNLTPWKGYSYIELDIPTLDITESRLLLDNYKIKGNSELLDTVFLIKY